MNLGFLLHFYSIVFWKPINMQHTGNYWNWSLTTESSGSSVLYDWRTFKKTGVSQLASNDFPIHTESCRFPRIIQRKALSASKRLQQQRSKGNVFVSKKAESRKMGVPSWFLQWCSRAPSLVAQMVKHLPTMWETWVRSLGRKIPWRRKWQPTPVTLAWKIPWTEEPGRLQSTGSQQVRHNWATSLHFFMGPWAPVSASQLTRAQFPEARDIGFITAVWSLAPSPTPGFLVAGEAHSPSWNLHPGGLQEPMAPWNW